MTVDDLQELYGELRGSRSAPAIMDARAFFLDRQWTASHAKLAEAYESYCESRQRILRQDPEKQVDAKAKDRDHQIRRLIRKQDKAREIIQKFESYLPQLERLAEREQAKNQAEATPAEASPQPEPSEAADAPAEASAESSAEAQPTLVLRKDSIDQAMLKQFSILIGERQLDFVSAQFDFKPLNDPGDVQVDAVYLLRKGDRCLLIDAQDASGDGTTLACVDICNAKNHVELSRQAMVRLSQKRKLVLLLHKA